MKQYIHGDAGAMAMARNGVTKKQQGLTLVELLIAVVVGATLLFGAFFVYNKIQGSNAASDAARNLTTIMADAQSKFKPQGNFTGVDAQTLIDLDIPPQSMISGSNMINGWGGSVTVTSASVGSGTDNAIELTYAGVDPAYCSNFVQASSGSADVIEVGGTEVKSLSGSLNVAGTNGLSSACANADDTTDYVFRKAL